MKIRYPALIRSALPPRHTRPRPAVVALESEFFVPDLADSDMPEVLHVMASVRWGGDARQTFRSFNGGLYVQTALRLDDFHEDLVNPFRPGGVFRGLFSDLKHHIRALDQRFRCWPDRISNSLINERACANFDRILESSHLVRPERAEDAESFKLDTEYWRDIHLRQLQLYAILDGKVWKRAPEPVFRVDTDFDTGRISMVYEDIFDTIPGLQSADASRSDFHFPVSALEDAVAFAHAVTPIGYQVDDQDRIEVTLESPRYLTLDVYRADLEKSAFRLVRELRPFRLVGQETAIDVGIKGLEDVLRSNRIERDTEAVAAAMTALLDASELMNIETRTDSARKVGFQCYRRHVEKWHDRPINTPDIGLPSPSFR